MTSTLTTEHRPDEFQEEYSYRVNLLLDEGREDLARALSDEYLDAVARLLSQG
jgi:hypothetical protein